MPFSPLLLFWAAQAHNAPLIPPLPTVAKAAKGAKAAAAPKAKKAAAAGDKPKRAPGPYMIFCKAERPNILSAFPRARP